LRELAEFVAALADYLRAEGRALKRALGRVAWALSLFLVAAVVLIAALGFALYALFLLLLRSMDPALAAFFVALVALVLAGGVAWVARLNLR